MRLCEILTVDRILVDGDGGHVRNKADALRVLADMLARALHVDRARLEEHLIERERLQSTGIGDGVAIPHTALEEAESQAAALLVCPQGIDFDAIDGGRVSIVFGVVGPKRATGEHLRTLARISRLLRDDSTRAQLASASSPAAAYSLIQAHDVQAR
ncbi:MAG TPA: PTS sugar transporter subunit IIA [Polyangiaceae bacterium]|nr:PTS sugar transporter subunit IIA [Polyangiaceae bacterium]